VAKEYGDPKHVFWLDLETYGLAGVPGFSPPFKRQHQKEGGRIFAELHRAEDVGKLTVKGIKDAGYVRGDPMSQRDAVFYQSVGEIERTVASWKPLVPSLSLTADDVMRHGVVHAEQQRVLEAVRAYLYRFVSNILAWAEAEKENQLLLGRDYHVVVGALEALQSGVGEELLAALGNLRTDNPAHWALSALACRNAILKLGRTLFVSSQETYDSELAQRPLKLGGEMEKNKLCAFIDWHFRLADEPTKSELKRLEQLVRNIYEVGSKGKSATRHAEAQQLVIDTFDLVNGLERLTGLQPVTYP
jgi:hypothetical protein